MALSSASQGAIVLTVFLLPVLTYIYFTRGSQAKSAGALPPPTEITKILIHPIKSCHGISVKSARLLPTGLDLDRQWMWVSHPDHEFLTIRNLSKMTLIRPSYNAESDTLTITAPAPNSIDAKLHFEIPAHPSKEWLTANTEVIQAKVWHQWTPSYCYSTDLTGPFNEFFGREVRLVYKPPVSEEPRELRSNGAKELLGRAAFTCFPDMMPILVGCQNSLDELNERLQKAEGLSINIRRFRPNIVVQGNTPWDEDRWKTLRIHPKAGAKPWRLGLDTLTLDVTQRCARCHVPNVDPDTAEEHKRQPWDTLMKYRRVDEGIKFKPCFGMLSVPRKGGVVEVGMKMEVAAVTDQHRYIPGF